jgi:predicted PurR-regulated permease PerM
MNKPTRIPDPERTRIRRSEPVDKAFVIELVAAIAVLWFFYKIGVILLPFVISAIIAFICTPVVEWLTRKARLPRVLASAVVFIVLAGVGGLVGYLALPPFVAQVEQLIGHLQTVLETLMTRLFGTGPIQFFGHADSPAQLADTTVNQLRNFLQQNGHLLVIAGAGIAGFFSFILSWVLLFYFLADGPRITNGLVWMVPPTRRPLIHRILPVLSATLRRYYVGVAAVVIYASMAAYLGLGVFLHIDHAVILAILTGILESIPVVGPAASAAIGVLAAMNQATSFSSIIAFAIYLTLLRVSIDNVLGPLILGSAGRISPVLVMFCFLSGAVLFGVAGVILAVPFALGIKVILEAVYGDPLG